jgi:hypothetical protein
MFTEQYNQEVEIISASEKVKHVYFILEGVC